jgi:uncharacterized protein YgiB involved in biofilm formation
MGNLILAAAILVIATVTVTGCKKLQEPQCAQGDSPALCKEVQKCFQSGTSVEVCREGERDAKSVGSNKRQP